MKKSEHSVLSRRLKNAHRRTTSSLSFWVHKVDQQGNLTVFAYNFWKEHTEVYKIGSKRKKIIWNNSRMSKFWHSLASESIKLPDRTGTYHSRYSLYWKKLCSARSMIVYNTHSSTFKIHFHTLSKCVLVFFSCAYLLRLFVSKYVERPYFHGMS